MNEVPAKFRIQDAQYGFPYHYVPTLEAGHFKPYFLLKWGFEYLSYINFCLDNLAELQWNSLLDVGCGDGRLVSLAGKRFSGRELVGIDASEQAIGLARLLSSGGHFVVGDVTRPDVFPAPFDVLTCVEVIEHIPPDALPEFVAGMRRQVSEGSRLILTVPSTNRPLNPKHYRHFTPDLLQSVLSPFFEPQKMLYLNGSDARFNMIKRLMMNKYALIMHQRALDAFYRFYVKNYLISNASSGGRVFGIFVAR